MSTEKWDSIDENPLVIADMLNRQWISEVNDFMEDPDFGRVLEMAIRIISGDVPEPAKVAHVCVKLEAYALKFRVMFATYMGMRKGTKDANMRKNMYKEIYSGIDRLVDSLKYLVK